jgi:hypothetical protein
MSIVINSQTLRDYWWAGLMTFAIGFSGLFAYGYMTRLFR